LLSGTDPLRILECALKMLNKRKKWKNPFGSGKSAEKIIKIVQKNEKI